MFHCAIFRDYANGKTIGNYKRLSSQDHDALAIYANGLAMYLNNEGYKFAGSVLIGDESELAYKYSHADYGTRYVGIWED